MEIIIAENKKILGKKAAIKASEYIRDAILERGEANIILATGTSQFDMLEELVKADIEWSRVRAFHLDEYIGITPEHPASFRKYLKERFADIVSPGEFIYINGNNDPQKECKRLGILIQSHPIDIACIGIGENGHLAFNDPPADFNTEEEYIVLHLDEACRNQQFNEGWFSSVGVVPEKAISMSIRQILKSRSIICCVPDLRKARAVKNSIEHPVSPEVPASILREHKNAWLYLDRESASMLAK